jgi:hypothetical protein
MKYYKDIMKQNVIVTLYLLHELYRETKRDAQEEGESFSAFLRRLLADKLCEEDEKRLFNSFS